MTSTIPKHVLAALLSIFLAISLIPLSPLQAKAEAGIPDAQEIDFATSSIQASEVPDGFVGISNVDDLLAIGDNLDGKFILMADIDLSGYSGPLSIGGSYLSAKGFTGMLEGNGHAIRGLGISIHEPESAQALTGLFGSMRGATVQNLSFEDASVELVDYRRSSDSIRYIGVLCGFAKDVTIVNCTIGGTVYVEDTGDGLWTRTGGMCGSVAGESVIEGCVNEASVTSPPSCGFDLTSGGICGELDGSGVTIRKCANYGAVSGANAAGICGYASTNGSSFSECANYGKITASATGASGSGQAGGMAGYSSASFEKCMNVGDVRGSGSAAGICVSAMTVRQCYNIGRIESSSVAGSGVSYHLAAGIIAEEASQVSGHHVIIADCFNAGNVKAENSNGDLRYDYASAAGIKAGGNMMSVEVTRCYNRGNLIAECDSSDGEVVGHIWARGKNYNDGVSSSDNYSLESATLSAVRVESSAQCTTLNEETMRKASSFSGFDFTETWGMGPEDYPYPTLRGVPGGYASNEPDDKPDKPVEKPWEAPDPLAAVAACELAAFVTSGGDEGVKGQSSILRELTSCELSEWSTVASFYDRPLWKGSDLNRCDLFEQELGSARVSEYSFSPNYVVVEYEGGCVIAFGNHRDMDLKTFDEHLENALSVYGKYVEKCGKERVFVTGSEYGGSLASYVCTLAGARGCVFNASGAGYDTAILNNYLDLADYSGVDGIECTHYYTPTYYDDRLSSGILGLRDAMDDFWSYPSISVADNGLTDDVSDICSMYSASDGTFSFNNLLREESGKATVRFSMEPSALFSTLASAVQGKPDFSLFSKSIVLSLGTSGADSFSSVWNESENWFTQVVLSGDAGSGTDRVKTGNWNDTIVSGEGDSKLNGGWGGDLYVIGGESCTVTIDDYAQTGLQSGVNAKKFFDIGEDLLNVIGSNDVAWDGLKGTYKVWKTLDDEELFQKDRIYFPNAALGDLTFAETDGYYVVEGGGATVKVNRNRFFGQDFEILDKNGDKASLKNPAKGKRASAATTAETLDTPDEGTMAFVAVKGTRAAYVHDSNGNLLHELDASVPCEVFESYGYFFCDENGAFEFEYDASEVEVSFADGTVADCRVASVSTDEGASLQSGAISQAAPLNGDVLHADYSSGIPELVVRDQMGNATGSLELEVREIAQQPTEDIGAAVSDDIPSHDYTGDPIEPAISLMLSGITLAEGVDYDLRYKGNTNAGKASAIVEGKGKYSGEKVLEFEIAPISIASASIEIPSNAFHYTGSPIEPDVSVTIGGVVLKEGVDYSTLFSDNVEIGAATVTVNGIGNYTDFIQATFEIETAEQIPDPDPEPRPQPATASRLGGADRYKTMALVSQVAFPEKGSCGTVIIARGDDFPDALAAAGLAGVNGGQVLLTQTSYLTADTKEEIKRLGATKVYVIGDKNSVSDGAFNEVKSLVGGNITRLGGASRYETALKIYEAGYDGWGETAIVAIGTKAPDALSASPVAYAMKAPIFLAGDDGNLSKDVLNEISNGGFDTVLIMGSKYSVSASAEKSLKKIANTVRFSGEDRYETSQLVADWALRNGFTCKNVVVTAGYNGKFADALVASSLGGKNASPLLLTDNGPVIDRQISKVIEPNKASISKAYVIGDENSLSNATYAAMLRAIS